MCFKLHNTYLLAVLGNVLEAVIHLCFKLAWTHVFGDWLLIQTFEASYLMSYRVTRGKSGHWFFCVITNVRDTPRCQVNKNMCLVILYHLFRSLSLSKSSPNYKWFFLSSQICGWKIMVPQHLIFKSFPSEYYCRPIVFLVAKETRVLLRTYTPRAAIRWLRSAWMTWITCGITLRLKRCKGRHRMKQLTWMRLIHMQQIGLLLLMVMMWMCIWILCWLMRS